MPLRQFSRKAGRATSRVLGSDFETGSLAAMPRDFPEQEPAMATKTFGDVRNRTAPPRSIPRRAVAHMIAAREAQAGRRVHAHLLGLDDATLAALGYDRKVLEDRRPRPRSAVATGQGTRHSRDPCPGRGASREAGARQSRGRNAALGSGLSGSALACCTAPGTRALSPAEDDVLGRPIPARSTIPPLIFSTGHVTIGAARSSLGEWRQSCSAVSELGRRENSR